MGYRGVKGVKEIWFREGYERRDREPPWDEERWAWLVLGYGCGMRRAGCQYTFIFLLAL